MIKILFYGVMSENNLGGPSLLHGAKEIIEQLHDKYEIVCYQSTSILDMAVNDMGFQIYQIPYKNMYNLYFDAIKYKLGIKLKNEQKDNFFSYIKTADIVANLYGICFCGNLTRKKTSFIHSIKSVFAKFSISIIAKSYNIKTIKCTASYGPMKTKSNITEARYASKHIFDVIYAREKESERQMQIEAGIKKYIPVSPDLANFMNYSISKSKLDNKIIGISISFQIIRQWNSAETYIDCMVNLIKHIIGETEYKIVLIPNEYTVGNKYNDIHVANDIHKNLEYTDEVVIPDVSNMNSSQIKNLIASCEVLIASRYHACVAALSAGVPTLVVGWHYKYEELLKLYGQDKWILSSENCTTNRLITMFNSFWTERDKEREIIKENYIEVRKALIDAGKVMFTK